MGDGGPPIHKKRFLETSRPAYISRPNESKPFVAKKKEGSDKLKVAVVRRIPFGVSPKEISLKIRLEKKMWW